MKHLEAALLPFLWFRVCLRRWFGLCSGAPIPYPSDVLTDSFRKRMFSSFVVLGLFDRFAHRTGTVFVFHYCYFGPDSCVSVFTALRIMSRFRMSVSVHNAHACVPMALRGEFDMWSYADYLQSLACTGDSCLLFN